MVQIHYMEIESKTAESFATVIEGSLHICFTQNFIGSIKEAIKKFKEDFKVNE